MSAKETPYFERIMPVYKNNENYKIVCDMPTSDKFSSKSSLK